MAAGCASPATVGTGAEGVEPAGAPSSGAESGQAGVSAGGGSGPASRGTSTEGATEGATDVPAEASQQPLVTSRFDPAAVPFRGSADAAVVVQVFSDFECPYCGMARSYTDRLLRDFPTVRFEYRHFPLAMHEYAGMAAEAAVEAYAQGGNDAFWCYQEALFEHQRDLSRGRMVSLARRCGVDGQALGQALDSGRHRARVERDRADGQRLGVQGTPTFTVNGALVDGAEYTDVEEAVDRALAGG